MAATIDKIIALCDGHGLETAGKRTPLIPEIGRFIKENEFNDAVVTILDKELQRCGFKTLLTAPDSSDVPLKKRTDLANNKIRNKYNRSADLYVSIHYNAYDGKFDAVDPEGFSVHVFPGANDAYRMGKILAKHLSAGTPQINRGVKKSDFHVLRETKMTAVLSENGFMDNKKEAMRMIDPAFQKEVAVEHAKAICEFYGVAYVPEPKKTVFKDIYAITLDGKRYGAFGDPENIARAVKKHLGVVKSIVIEKI